MEGSRNVGFLTPAGISSGSEVQTFLHVRSGSSAALGNCEELSLHPGGSSPTQSASIFAWPSSQWPVHARSVSPVSLQSSNGSGYLTPPLEAVYETVPYKPARNDLVSLNMRNGRKRKGKANHWNVDCGATEQTSEPLTPFFEEVRDVQTKYLPAKDSDGKSFERSLPAPSEYSRTSLRFYRSPSNVLIWPQHKTSVEQGSWQSKLHPTNIFSGRQHELAKQSTSDIPRPIHNNLARISQALAARNHRGWILVKPGALPVPTYSTVIAIQAYKPKSEHEHSSDASTARHDSLRQPGISARPRESPRAGFRVQRPGVKSKRLCFRHAETPATITLRRASGINIEEVSEAAEAGSCQVEIIHPVPEQSLKRGMTRIMQLLPSYGVVAETAMTYADVHVSPPMVTRKLLGEVVESSVSRLRRISAVQIRARSSVHEVIWKDECSSSSSSSAGQKSPRLSLQLTRTQSDPSEISCFRNPLLDRELDPARKCSSTGSRSCPNPVFVEDESSMETQVRVIRPPNASLKLSEWTWSHKSDLGHGHSGAMLSFQSKGSSLAVRDESKPAVNPLSDQGVAPEELSGEPCVQPSRPMFASCNRLQQASCTRQMNHTTEDYFTRMYVSPINIERTPARTARRTTLSVLPESQQRTNVMEPRRKNHARYSMCATPRIRDALVAGSAIGSSSRMRRSSRPH